MLDFAALKALADQLPDGMESHGGPELPNRVTVPPGRTWVDVGPRARYNHNEDGRRMQTVMQAAAHFKQLVAECERLRAENDQLRDIDREDEYNG